MLLPNFSVHGCLPFELDRVGLDVSHAKVPDLKCGRKHGTLEGTPSGDSLVQIQSGTQLSLEDVCDDLFDGRDTGCPSN